MDKNLQLKYTRPTVRTTILVTLLLLASLFASASLATATHLPLVTVLDAGGIDQIDTGNGAQQDITGAIIGHGEFGWAWDETVLSGNNSSDTCTYFRESDGSVTAVCYSVQYESDGTITSGFPQYAVYSCTADQYTNGKCTGNDTISTEYSVMCTDPAVVDPYFTGDPDQDLQATCTLTGLNGNSVDNLQLLNTCSKPSASPASLSNDCLFSELPAYLKLVKVVEGETALPGGWTLYWDGTGTNDGSVAGDNTQFVPVPADTYILSESAVDNYEQVSLVCETATGDPVAVGADNSITLASGAEVACTFTNKLSKLSPTVTTQVKAVSDNSNVANGGHVIVGTGAYDTATLNGATATAGGTITYKVYSDSTCTTEVADLTPTSNTVTDGSAPNSDSFTFTSIGTYYFQAVYSGDDRNFGATSACDSEIVIVDKASPTIATTQQPATATVGDTINDSATVSGGYNPGGTVTFALYSPSDSTCSGTPVYTQDVTLSGGTATTSPGYATIVSGTYRWVAIYSGDSNNNGATSGCTLEPVTINKASPTIATTQQPATAIVGDTINDSATVSGGYNPGGTVTFALYSPSDSTCSGTPVYTQDVTLSGGTATTSPGYATIVSGTYRWVAIYSGDANNNGATSGCTLEPVTINKASPTIATTQQPATATVGDTINDSATVSGGYNPGGTVTFALYPPSDSTCSGTPVYTQDVTLSGGTATTSPGFATTTVGTYRWVAIYSGDSNNNGATSGCTLEPVTINKASPTIATTQQPATATVGDTINDSATVSGGYNPGGTVTFALYSPSDSTCSGTPVYTQDVTLSGGTATTSPGFATTTVGTYRWVAIYSGDSNNNGATSGCTLEPVTINKASPTIATTQQPATATVGDTINDSATVSGGYNPGGTVTFALYPPSDDTCSSTPVYTQDVTLRSGAATTSPGFATTTVGTYRWVAIYSGDANNNGATSGCTLEPVTINKASPTIATTQQPATAAIGSTVNDKATVSGGYNPGGTVTFSLYPPSDSTCSGTPVYTQDVTLSGGTATTSPGYATTTVGIYRWVAIYSGDANNNGATSGCTLEPVDITKASPTVVTTPQPASGSLGVVLNDSAVLSGGYQATGSITFKLYPPSDATCSGTPVFTQVVTVNGDGTYVTTGGYDTDAQLSSAFNRVGTWRWVAVYSGDGSNNAYTSGCQEEQVSVSYHPGTIGFWRNWRNQYTSAQMDLLINYLKVNNPKVYSTLTIAKLDAIFNYGTKTPREQQILGQLTALKLNLAVTQLDGTSGIIQKNSDLCLAATVNVSGISGATALFGTATPTVGQIVNFVEGKWTGTLTTNKADWKFNLTNAQKDILIKVLTGINEGTLVMNSGC